MRNVLISVVTLLASASVLSAQSLEFYMNPEDNAIDLRKGVARYIDYYNNGRYHRGIDHQIPAARYAAAVAA